MKETKKMVFREYGDKLSERIDWVDFARGVAIVFVIFGHSVTVPIVRAVIFSFHMPLFFILSAFTTVQSSDNAQFVKKTEKSFSRLIIPALLIYLFRILIYVVHRFHSINWDSFIIEKINVLVYGSGVDVTVGGGRVPAFGMMWFLLVLFTGRTLFDYMHLKLSKKNFILCVFVCSVIGVVLGQIQWLPFAFDITFAIMPFFICGFYCRKLYDKSDRLLGFNSFFVLLIIWGFSLFVSFFLFNDYLELADRRYPLFPLCFITAISGSFIILSLSYYLCKYKIISPFFIYFGRNSLWVFFVHSIDYVYPFLYNVTENSVFNGLFRCLADCVLCFCILTIKKYLTVRLKSR